LLSSIVGRMPIGVPSFNVSVARPLSGGSGPVGTDLGGVRRLESEPPSAGIVAGCPGPPPSTAGPSLRVEISAGFACA
jgi:hypothetical protein